MKNNPFFTNPQKIASVKIRLIPLVRTQNRSQILKKIEISSFFHMKYSALFEYYGDDLIEYKKLAMTDVQRNEFLRIFSSYLTDFLENTMPTSWKNCSPHFLKQLFYLYLPSTIQITKEKQYITYFLEEFKSFAAWLDKKEDTTWLRFMNTHTNSLQTLQICEELLHSLFLQLYPTYLQEGRNDRLYMESTKQRLSQCHQLEDGLFQVTAVDKHSVTLLNIFTYKIYQVDCSKISKKHLGMIIDGTIGILDSQSPWTLLVTLGVYPKEAKICFTNL